MRVLVVCDDYYHPAEVVRAGLALMQGYEFDIIEDSNEWSAEKMAEYPVVLFAKSNNVTAAIREPWETPEVLQAFVDYVRSGKGLLAIHSGTVCKDLPALRALIGGAFDFHPAQCPVTVAPTRAHPITEGVEPFTAKDEHYHMIMDDPDVDLFMTTTSEHSVQPGGWTRMEGAGRVCVLTPGHTTEVFTNPNFLRMIDNALNWCVAQG